MKNHYPIPFDEEKRLYRNCSLTAEKKVLI